MTKVTTIDTFTLLLQYKYSSLVDPNYAMLLNEFPNKFQLNFSIDLNSHNVHAPKNVNFFGLCTSVVKM